MIATLQAIPARWVVALVVVVLSLVSAAAACTALDAVAVGWCADGCGPGHLDYVDHGECGCLVPCDAPSAAALEALDRR